MSLIERVFPIIVLIEPDSTERLKKFWAKYQLDGLRVHDMYNVGYQRETYERIFGPNQTIVDEDRSGNLNNFFARTHGIPMADFEERDDQTLTCFYHNIFPCKIFALKKIICKISINSICSHAICKFYKWFVHCNNFLDVRFRY